MQFLKSRVEFIKKVTFQGREEKLAIQISVKSVFQEEVTVKAKTLRQEHVWFAPGMEQQGSQGCCAGTDRVRREQ